MDHIEKMDECRKFIWEMAITDDTDEYNRDGNSEIMILVDDVHHVRDVYYADIEKREELLKKGWDKDEAEFEIFGDCLFDWLDNHKIKWK